jgi:Phage integrase family
MAEINKRVSLHTLRYSFATHLLEQDIDVRLIHELLSHAKLDMAALYTRVATKTISQVMSPLQHIAINHHACVRRPSPCGRPAWCVLPGILADRLSARALTFRLFNLVQYSLWRDVRRSFLKFGLFLGLNRRSCQHVIQQPDNLRNLVLCEQAYLKIQLGSFVSISRKAILRDQYKRRKKYGLN